MHAHVKLGIAGSFGIALLALPLRLADPAKGLIRVNDACGQATECEKAEKYICSQKEEDKKEHKCKAGCDE